MVKHFQLDIMKRLNKFIRVKWFYIGITIFLILTHKMKCQCVISCNSNVGIYSTNNAATIAYDNMGSSFHSTFVAEEEDYRIWGEHMHANGRTHLLAPMRINTINYPELTGTVYYVGLGSKYIGNVQLIVLTSTGLFAGGIPGAVLSTSIKSTYPFEKLTINGKKDGLPLGITPDSIKMMFVTYHTIILTTCGGNVYVLTQEIQMSGNQNHSSNQWSQVMESNGSPLKGVIAARGTSRVGFALKSDATIWTWGNGAFLGDGTDSKILNRATQMIKPGGLHDIKMIQATSNDGYTPEISYYILGTDRKVYSLGANQHGQLGDNTTINRMVWVNTLNTNNSIIDNAVWISSNEHDLGSANLGMLNDKGNALTCGHNSTFMIGRTVNSGYNNLNIPDGITMNDTILFCEVGGHTSAFVKKNTRRYGYVGHHINGSVGNGNSSGNVLSSVNFIIPPIINVCGTKCDTPQIYHKSFRCGDTQMFFIIRSKSGSTIKYQLDLNSPDSAVLGNSDSIIIYVYDKTIRHKLKLLSVQNASCNINLELENIMPCTVSECIHLTNCSKKPIVWNGKTYHDRGIYFDTLSNVRGSCDSINVLIISHQSPSRDTIEEYICKGEHWFWNQHYLKETGYYSDTFIASSGCDSIATLHLIIKPYQYSTTEITICAGNEYIFNGKSLFKPGTYYDTFSSSNFMICDSIVILILNVKPLIETHRFDSICSNQIFIWNGDTIKKSGIYCDTFSAQSGCDSIAFLHIKILPKIIRNITACLVYGHSYIYRHKVYKIAGIYTDSTHHFSLCDTLFRIEITEVKPIIQKKDTYSCNPIKINAKLYTKSDSSIIQYKSQMGCDSLHQKTYIHISSPPFNDTFVYYFCDTFRHRGNLYSMSKMFRDTLKKLVYPGCDSLYNLRVFTKLKKPEVFLSDTHLTIVRGNSIRLTANGAWSYYWSTHETTPSILVKPQTHSEYYVIGKNNDCIDSLHFTITVLSDSCRLDFPRAFTPNGDGNNDIYLPRSFDGAKLTSFKIFNRMGQLLFYTTNENEGWDGYYNGVSQNSENYFYTYEAELCQSKKRTSGQGIFLLIK